MPRSQLRVRWCSVLAVAACFVNEYFDRMHGEWKLECEGSICSAYD